jgi:peptidoglycan lytic transglycosylase G
MDDRPSYLADPDPDIDRRRRRIALVALLSAFTVVVVAIAAVVNTYRGCRQPPAADGSTVQVVIVDGATGDRVVRLLSDHGLVRCGGTFGDLLLRSTGRANAILPGTYDIPMGASLDEILDQMTTPPDEVPTVRVTIPEGLRIASTFPGERSISSLIEEQTGVPAKQVIRYANSGTLSGPPFLKPGQSPEGFLFPDTYEFVKKGLDARTIVDEMLAEFRRQAKELDLKAGAARLGLTPSEVVTVASMIEREAQVDGDRALIAGVIYNRLRTSQTLGIDATLLYDDPSPDGKLSSSDLDTNSPYNTRINAGLPPTPIANPGRASLEAALHPAKTDYFYYVLCPKDGEGVHRFAKTYQEHLANVQECLGG